MDTERRAISAPALRKLIEAARSERGHAPLHSAEREFYLGVDAAAEGLLHPQTLSARPEDWLERESRAFADGYLTAVADITAAVSGEQLAVRLSLPEVPARYSASNGEPS